MHTCPPMTACPNRDTRNLKCEAYNNLLIEHHVYEMVIKQNITWRQNAACFLRSLLYENKMYTKMLSFRPINRALQSLNLYVTNYNSLACAFYYFY